MARQNAVVPVVILLAVGLAGCIGGDDGAQVEASDGAEKAVATARTGSVTGQVMTVDLEALVGVELGLLNRTGGVELTKTDDEGRYTFNQLKPGAYRLQMTDACCKVKTVNVQVVAGNVSQVNLQVQKLSSIEQRLPYVVIEQWDGFLACGFALGGNADDTCGESDSNHAIHHTFTVEEGLKEIVAGMTWTPTSTAVSDELRYSLHRPGDGTGDARCRHFLVAGPPPLIGIADETTAWCDDVHFPLINGTMDIQYEIAVGGIGATYQQGFTIHWHEFYNRIAPAGFNPIPDG